MEWIGIGIAIAIGFYVAPFVLALATGAIVAIVVGISCLFGHCK